MTAFATAIDAIYADPNFGVAATYTPQVGSPVAVTLIWTRPDDTVELSGMATRLPKRVGKVRVSQLADPKKGDTLTVGAATFTVGDRHRDELGLEWSLDLKG